MTDYNDLPTVDLVSMLESGELTFDQLNLIKIPSFTQCLNDLILSTDISVEVIANRAGMNKTSLYKALSGDLLPVRETILCIASVLDLNMSQTQLLLKTANRGELTPRNERDQLIMKGLMGHLALGDIDDSLRKAGMQPLLKDPGAKKGRA